jgi:hypothetical protein
MTARCLAAAAIALPLALACPAMAQPVGDPPPAEEGWEMPRTSWGDPDLTGMWPLDTGRTPVQRNPSYGEQAYLTEEQYEAAREAAQTASEGYEREGEAGTIGVGHWFEYGDALRQTSLIMEPANGRIPPLTEKGEQLAANMESSWSDDYFYDLGDFNSLDRCISRGLTATMVPFPYNNGVEIFQSPGYVVMKIELVSDARIIPLDGRPPIPGQIEQWMGESRGRWEGNSLVIETTNFNGGTPMVIVGPTNQPIPTSKSMKVVERLTPVGPDRLYYEAWVEDPEILTGPWKMQYPWIRDEDYEAYEYACHEGNTTIRAYIEATHVRFGKDPRAQLEARAAVALAGNRSTD